MAGAGNNGSCDGQTVMIPQPFTAKVIQGDDLKLNKHQLDDKAMNSW